MRLLITTLLIFSQGTSIAQERSVKEQKYTLINLVKRHDGNGEPYTIGVANQKDIDKLSNPLRGLATYYTCFIQCECEYAAPNDTILCGLTNALGLGYQGSAKHVAMLKKWFPGNNEIESAIKDKYCLIGNPGSSNYLEYHTLKFNVRHDTVTVNYEYEYYSHGEVKKIRKKDVAIIKNDRIVFYKPNK